jgi:TPR repeat protein
MGQGVARADAQAWHGTCKGAEVGSGEAMRMMGWLVLRRPRYTQQGASGNRDYFPAVELYRESVDAGNTVAMSNLGNGI